MILDRTRIEPEVLTLPRSLKVTYEEARVNLGNVLTPTQVKDIPTISYPNDPDAFYALCMTDPDVPSRQEPKYREWHHWLVGNIPGDKIKDGEILSEYVGSGPPKGTGENRFQGSHDYIFDIDRQAAKPLDVISELIIVHLLSASCRASPLHTLGLQTT